MISAVILTKNEEKNLERCLKSLQWCDEIVVVDDNSSDRTLLIAKKYQAKIFERNLDNNFAEQRNYALRQVFNGESSRTAQGEWVFFVDADEEVTEKLKEEIINKINNHHKIVGFYFKRKDYFLGKWLKHGETASVRLLRLAKKGCGWWKREVDEVWEMWEMGEMGEMDNPLLHYPHPTVKEFLESLNSRSTLNARIFYDQGRTVNLFEWFKPLLKFVQNYFLRLGFLDGIQGFLMAALMSFHSFLVRGKLYLIWKKEGGWH